MMPANRVWNALGTTRTVRVISIGMLLYFVVIGGLTYGYAQVSDCLADWSDTSAISAAARADAAADDRRLNDAERVVDDSDRARYRADAAAMAGLLAQLGNPEGSRDARAKAFVHLLKVTTETSHVLDANEAERARIRAERQVIEAERQRNPVPPPPSQTC